MSRIAEAAEILRDAVFALCDDRPLVERLAHMHGVLERLEPDVLPERFRFHFEELRADFAFGADTIADALARMSGEDRRLAQALHELAEQAADENEQQQLGEENCRAVACVHVPPCVS